MARKQLLLAAVCLIVGGALGFWLHPPSPSAPGPVLSPVDIGFAQDMAVHHEQAVLLSRTLPAGASPQIRGIAERIVLAQTGEIAQLRGWLQLFELPLTTATPMRWMQGQHDHGGAPMPGMASVAEITTLAGLRGAEAEILFLQLMIRHHHGGIDMAQAAFNTGSNAAVKRVALDMVNEQGNETGQMTALLTARNAQPLS
ncbi:DUF305 domain-containing protein [Nocardia sp. XZ_19_385]|uniref:DUF305 domain-containing protein n=1 Tax=Nocardia sp. XZ_19_385 TaxID=2769488 RepID=UPI001E5C7602|nr:DUF305 domain-containing protein [Nocardia sp. XZ_19_385]